jgi:transcriptional regulator with XRE-family HTH domain
MPAESLYDHTDALYSGLHQMPGKEAEKLLRELKEWADAEYGRRAKLAQLLGVSKQLVSEWFAGRSVPTWDHGLAIEAFLKKQRQRANPLFLFDVLADLPQGMDGPWGKVLVENKFRGNPSSTRNLAGMVALAAGQRKWGSLVRLFADLVPQACTCDLSQLPEPDYESDLGRAWVLPPELQPLVRLIAHAETF